MLVDNLFMIFLTHFYSPFSILFIPEFATFLENLRSSSLVILKRTKTLLKMYALMDKHSIKTPTRNQILHDDLVATRDEYFTLLREANIFVDSGLPTMNNSLTLEMNSLDSQLSNILEELNTGI